MIKLPDEPFVSKRISFKLEDVELFTPEYRTDTPAPAEYEPVWCERCQKLHYPDPLAYNKTIDRLSQEMADAVDEQILHGIIEEANQ